MTIEEKAKAYDEALERAKKVNECKAADREPCTSLCEYIFPELKESEDECIEKIKKDIISYLNNRQITSIAESSATERWLSWLEKQGEQNSANKVEPKFKVGDWCIDNEDGTIFQIVKVLDNTYTYKTNEGSVYSCTHYSLENDCHLWTIADAKDGDILYAKGSYFKEYVFKFSSFTEDNVISTHFGYDVFHGTFDTKLSRFGREEDFVSVTPATKEQRDTLMQAMTNAGWQFDFEKKELKKNDQNSACSEDDERLRKTSIAFLQEFAAKGYENAIECMDWLKSLKIKL